MKWNTLRDILALPKAKTFHGLIPAGVAVLNHNDIEDEQLCNVASTWSSVWGEKEALRADLERRTFVLKERFGKAAWQSGDIPAADLAKAIEAKRRLAILDAWLHKNFARYTKEQDAAAKKLRAQLGQTMGPDDIWTTKGITNIEDWLADLKDRTL